MRYRIRIGTIMVGTAAVGVGLAASLEWRRGASPAPSMASRMARAVLDGRSARLSARPPAPDSAALVAFGATAFVASRAVRAIAARRRDR